MLKTASTSLKGGLKYEGMQANCQPLPKIELGDATRNHWILQKMEGGKGCPSPAGAKLARQEEEKAAVMMEGARAAGGSPLWGKRSKRSHHVPETFLPN